MASANETGQVSLLAQSFWSCQYIITAITVISITPESSSDHLMKYALKVYETVGY